jgi:hypothetical protein
MIIWNNPEDTEGMMVYKSSKIDLKNNENCASEKLLTQRLPWAY